MPRTMTPALKTHLDKLMGMGGAAKLILLINSGHTALDGPTQWSVEKMLDGIGEAKAFTDACAANTASATLQLRTAMMNRLEHELGGRGNADELLLCIADGTIT